MPNGTVCPTNPSMLAIVLTVIAVSPLPAAQTVYHVGQVNCSDTGAGAPAQPFCTIQKCASLMPPPGTGLTCQIHKGIYRETVQPAGSGTASMPTVFEVAIGETATVSGADVLSGPWTLQPSGHYTTPLPPLALRVGQLFVDGQMRSEARWPNAADPTSPVFARADVGTTDFLLKEGSSLLPVPPSGPPAESWANARLHILGGKAWSMYTPLITGGDGVGGFTLSDIPPDVFPPPPDPPLPVLPIPGNKYFLSGKLFLADKPYEWFKDETHIHVQPSACGSSPCQFPGASIVELKMRDIAFDLRDRDYIQVKGLNVFAATILTNAQSDHNHLDGLTLSYVSHHDKSVTSWIGPRFETGVVLAGSHNTLANSSVTFSAGNGVRLEGDSNTMINCLVRDADYEATMAAPILLGGSDGPTNSVVHWNSVARSGRDGVHVGSYDLSENEIAHNEIREVGLSAQDLGGIYSSGATGGATTLRIHHNRLHDLQAKTGGGVGAHTGAGIYVDFASGGVLAHHNVVWK